MTLTSLLASPWPWIILGAITLSIILVKCYIQAPPAVAYILSGVFKKPRIFIGTGGLKIPFLERLDKVYLGQVTVDVMTSESIPTNDFINVRVDAVAKVRIKPTPEGIQLAAKNFLNMDTETIARELGPTLQGNMREIIGTLDLKTLNIDRDQFSKKVVQSADLDMDKLGIEILSFNIQSVTDEKGLIEDLGADNTALIKKNASITKAEADKEVAIATAQAQKAANDARVEAERAIAEKNNELAIIKAELKVQEDTKKATADAAYEIQRQEQMKLVNEKTVEAEIAQTQKEQVLAEEKVKVTQNELRSTINVKADAEKYRTQTNADAQKYQIEIDAAAELERRKRRAEAETYEAERAAEAQKAKADAMKFEMEQKALGIKAEAEAKAYGIEKCGIAEAEAIKLKGLAEAEAMEKKAEAFEKYGNAAIIEMMTKVLPEVAAKVAEPISAVRDITIYGGDCSTVAGNVPSVMKQSMDVLTSVTGVDMTEVVKAQTAVNKTITVDGDVLHEVNKRSKK